MKPKDFWNYLRNKKKNKRCEDEERNWFWTFGIWNTWKGENVVTNKELNFAFAQPTNWDNFSDEEYSESQEDENDSIIRYNKENILLIKHKKYG